VQKITKQVQNKKVVVEGTKDVVLYKKAMTCPECKGTGKKLGREFTLCENCDGSGKI
jgi:DnaJ-class molecular chaperone